MISVNYRIIGTEQQVTNSRIGKGTDGYTQTQAVTDKDTDTSDKTDTRHRRSHTTQFSLQTAGEWNIHNNED